MTEFEVGEFLEGTGGEEMTGLATINAQPL